MRSTWEETDRIDRRWGYLGRTSRRRRCERDTRSESFSRKTEESARVELGGAYGKRESRAGDRDSRPEVLLEYPLTPIGEDDDRTGKRGRSERRADPSHRTTRILESYHSDRNRSNKRRYMKFPSRFFDLSSENMARSKATLIVEKVSKGQQ